MTKLPPPPKPAHEKGAHPVKQAELARMLGISRQLLQHHRKKSPSAPKSMDVGEWKRFLIAVGRSGTTSPQDVLMEISKRKLSILATKDETDKDALRVSRGELIEFSEVVSLLQDVVGIGYWAEFDRISFEMPPNLVGLSAAQMFIEFKKEKDKMVKSNREKVAAWIAKQEAKKI